MHKVFLGTACFLFSALSIHAQSPLEKGLQSINRTSAEAIVEFLADDELQGREALAVRHRPETPQWLLQKYG